MGEKFGVNLVPYMLTPNQVALMEWMKRNPHSRIEIVTQDGVPMQALVPTEDGLGRKSVLFSDLTKKM